MAREDALKIQRAENGWLIIYKDWVDNDLVEKTWVCEEGEYPADGFASVLRIANELLGPTSGRHDEKRIYIEVKPGDKYEVPHDA